jgi:YfiH family protein
MIIPQWPAPDNVKALVTEREVLSTSQHQNGLGQSLPPYNSFNLGDHVNDLPRHVSVNRQQLVEHAQGCDDIRWLQQVHGIHCPDANLIANVTEADATFTRTPALACAVMTADCLPVLFCDLQGRQVAAAHAGWRGLANGVLENTLQTFTQNGIALNQIIAWLGPAISQPAFEVGPDVKKAFGHFNDGQVWADEACFVAGAEDRLQADLYRLARLQLEHLGIKGVYGAGTEDVHYCTATDTDAEGEPRFFSYRRQAITGRQASLIWLNK